MSMLYIGHQVRRMMITTLTCNSQLAVAEMPNWIYVYWCSKKVFLTGRCLEQLVSEHTHKYYIDFSCISDRFFLCYCERHHALYQCGWFNPNLVFSSRYSPSPTSTFSNTPAADAWPCISNKHFVSQLLVSIKYGYQLAVPATGCIFVTYDSTM